MYWPDVAAARVADEPRHGHVLAELPDGRGDEQMNGPVRDPSARRRWPWLPAFSISVMMSDISFWKSSVRATKSDSQLTSTSVPLVWSADTR